ncbi:MAG: chromate transporter [Fretibacterium sp.]|nr:chromate transporter [Fretibacterium sp.]
MKNSTALRALFLQFLKFGCFTFGGGWSIVAQMKELYVDGKGHPDLPGRGNLSVEALLDLTSIGRSLPGTMIGNIAMFYGYHTMRPAGGPLWGILGGLACVLGMVLPPAAVLALITSFYTAFRDNLWAAAAMRGVRTAVVPIVLSALLGMLRGAFRYPPCLAVALLTFALYFLWNVSCVWLVVTGMACGLVICEFYERRPRYAHPA